MNAPRTKRRDVRFRPGVDAGRPDTLESRSLLSGWVPSLVIPKPAATVEPARVAAAVVFDPRTQFNHDWARLEVPATVEAGQWLTLKINNIQEVDLSCSYAREARLDGKSVATVRDMIWKTYQYYLSGSTTDPPQPGPLDRGVTILKVPKGLHEVSFRIDSAAPDAKLSFYGSQGGRFYFANSPWVCASGSYPGLWSSLVSFEIRARNPLTMGLKVTPAASVKPGGTLRYSLNSGCSEPFKSLVVTDKIPTGTKLVPGSITAGGTIKKGVITWRFSQPRKTSFGFQVTVNKPLKNLTAITDTATLIGTLKSGHTVTKTLSSSTAVKV